MQISRLIKLFNFLFLGKVTAARRAGSLTFRSSGAETSDLSGHSGHEIVRLTASSFEPEKKETPSWNASILVVFENVAEITMVDHSKPNFVWAGSGIIIFILERPNH